MPLHVEACPPAGDNIPGQTHRSLEDLPGSLTQSRLPDSVPLKDSVATSPNFTVLGFNIDLKGKLFRTLLKVSPHPHQRH